MAHHSNWKYGDKREDGYIYGGQRRNRPTKEIFYSPESFKKMDEGSKTRKREKSRKIKKIENDIKTDRGCAHCGHHFKRNPEVLDWHHPNPSDKKFDISSIRGNSWKQLEIKKKEWKKCIVLCSNCHRKETKRIRDARN